MNKIDSIWVGWIETSIGFLVKDYAELIGRFRYVLITSIDSSRDLQTLRTTKQIVGQFKDCKFLDGSLVVTEKVFSEIVKAYNLFNGFDEIWLFPHSPSIKLPPDVWITGPLDITKEVPKGLVEWMISSGCILGLGDGIGLNFATSDKTIASLLEEGYRKAETV